MSFSKVSQRLLGAGLAAAVMLVAGCATSGGSMSVEKGMATDKAAMKDTTASMKSTAEPMPAPMKESGAAMMAMDPMKSGHAAIDRFSATAGHLQMRDAMNKLPGPNQPVDFDKPPFVTTGLGPKGETVMYYNFDVQSTTPAPLYMLVRKGDGMAISGQLPIVDVIPGDPGYNDFWQVTKVTVPDGYVANTVGSLQASPGRRLSHGEDRHDRELSDRSRRLHGAAPAERDRHRAPPGLV